MASTIRSILPWAGISVALAAAGGAAWSGSDGASSATAVSAAAGATSSVLLQVVALRAYARALPDPRATPERSPLETNERALRALGAAAAIRLFGGVLVIVAATRIESLRLWPFVAGFAFGYALLEIAVGRWLIAQERRG